MIKKSDLIDGGRYMVTFNNGKDYVSATWLSDYGVFTHLVGSISYSDANEIEVE